MRLCRGTVFADCKLFPNPAVRRQRRTAIFAGSLDSFKKHQKNLKGKRGGSRVKRAGVRAKAGKVSRMGSDWSARVRVMRGDSDRDADGGVGPVGACPSHVGASRQRRRRRGRTGRRVSESCGGIQTAQSTSESVRCYGTRARKILLQERRITLSEKGPPGLPGTGQ